MTGLGLLLMFVGLIAFILGVVLVCFESTQKSGLIVLLSGITSLIVGFSVCSSFPFSMH
jgi:uncharacterized membrane protein HdeD (DUF308 family)